MKLDALPRGKPAKPRPPLYLLSEICTRLGVPQRVLLGVMANYRNDAPVARMQTKTTPGAGSAGLYAMVDFRRWIDTNHLDLGKYQ